MPKYKIVLTAQDREELAPLLNISKAERELMPQEILDKLEILAKEQEEGAFQDLEEIITESLHIVQSLEPSTNANSLYQTHSRRRIKHYLWWRTNREIFLARRKAARSKHRKSLKNH